MLKMGTGFFKDIHKGVVGDVTSGRSHEEPGGCRPHFLPLKYMGNVRIKVRLDLRKNFLTPDKV